MKLTIIKGYWTTFWRFWSVKIQLFAVALTGWLWFDPASLLMAWQMLPAEVRSVLPGNFMVAVGAILFLLNFAAIIARGVPQPKATAKLAAKAEASNGAN